MNFSERIKSRVQKLEIPNLLRDWIASSPSRYSAPDGTKYWLPHVSKSREALYALFLAEYLPYWETMEIYQRIGQLAYQQRYQGNWELVQEILEQNQVGSLSEKIWLEFLSADDFFGNFLKEVNSFLRRNRKVYRSYDSKRRAKHKVRRRGYQDKGFQRPPHERGRNLPDPEPGIDRRERIIHPLLLNLPEGSGGETLPSESKGKERFEDELRSASRSSQFSTREETRGSSSDGKDQRGKQLP